MKKLTRTSWNSKLKTALSNQLVLLLLMLKPELKQNKSKLKLKSIKLNSKSTLKESRSKLSLNSSK